MRIAAVALALVSLSLSAAAPVPKHLMKDEPLWPAEVGTRWVYAAGDAEATVELTEVKEDKGVTIVTDRRVEDGKPGRVWQTVRVSGEGVFVSDDGGIRCDPPACLLRAPGAGEKWAVGFAFGDRRYTGRRTAGAPEEVNVPAGRFRAVPVSSDLELADVGKDRYTVWYAPGVGEVKMITGPGAERVLKSFTPGRR